MTKFGDSIPDNIAMTAVEWRDIRTNPEVPTPVARALLPPVTTWTDPRPAADRFALTIEGVLRVLFRRLGGPLLPLVYNRVSRLARRFAALAAHIRAGTLRPPRRRAPRPASSRPASPRPPDPVPRGFAWLIRLLPPPHELPTFGSQLQHLLTDPEMQALIAADKRVGRTLRPLCHMLGVLLPPELKLPPRPRRPRAKALAPRGGGLGGGEPQARSRRVSTSANPSREGRGARSRQTSPATQPAPAEPPRAPIEPRSVRRTVSPIFLKAFER